MASFAAINGVYFGHQNVDFRVSGFQIVGLKSINYKYDVSKADVRGASQIQLGVTPGRYTPSGDFEIFAPQAATLISLLAPQAAAFNGLANLSVPVSISFGPVPGAFPPFVSHVLPSVYLVGQENGSSEGDEGLTVKFTMKIVQPIVRNGVPDIVDLNSIGAIG